VEVQEEEEGNKAVKEKNHGSCASIKMRQKKHNLGHTKNTINNEEVESEDKALEKALRENADPLQYCGGKAWQGDSVDEKSTSSQKKPAHKKSNVEKMNERHNSNSEDLGEIKIPPLNSKTVTKMLLFSIPSMEMISRRKLLRTLSCQ
jgi:hypothetical protein